MIALLTIHYHSPETLCIQSDGGGKKKKREGRERERERERGVWFWRGVCLLEGPAVRQYET